MKNTSRRRHRTVLVSLTRWCGSQSMMQQLQWDITTNWVYNIHSQWSHGLKWKFQQVGIREKYNGLSTGRRFLYLAGSLLSRRCSNCSSKTVLWWRSAVPEMIHTTDLKQLKVKTVKWYSSLEQVISELRASLAICNHIRDYLAPNTSESVLPNPS